MSGGYAGSDARTGEGGGVRPLRRVGGGGGFIEARVVYLREES